MRRQASTLLASGLAMAVLVFVGLRLPAPYVRDVAGPVSDTLGTVGGDGASGAKQLLVIGHPTATPKGRLYLVTVSEFGGPDKSISGLDVLLGWLHRNEAIIPRDLVYPSNDTASSEAKQETTEMVDSQADAKNAALAYLGYIKPVGVDVAAVDRAGLKGQLDAGDVIVGVDSTAVTTAAALVALTSAHKAGDQLTLHVMRDGAEVAVPVTLQAPANGGTSPTIGIEVADSYSKAPFAITITLPNVGGPSAGTAFALGIIDKLTDGDLTGGRTVAVTGEIDASGNISAIGGVVQKMAGARAAGATVFMVPKDNCAEALTDVPAGLRLIPLTTLAAAVSSLKTLDAGGTVASCPAK